MNTQLKNLLQKSIIGNWKFTSYTHRFFDANGVETSVLLNARPNSTIRINNLRFREGIDDLNDESPDFITSTDVPFTGIIGSGANIEDITIRIEDAPIIIYSLDEALSDLGFFESPTILNSQFNKFKSQNFTHILQLGQDLTSNFSINVVKRNDGIMTYKCRSNYFLIKEVSKTHLILLKAEIVGITNFGCGLHVQGKKVIAPIDFSAIESTKILSKSSILVLNKI